jgi:hypothetical protein
MKIYYANEPPGDRLADLPMLRKFVERLLVKLQKANENTGSNKQAGFDVGLDWEHAEQGCLVAVLVVATPARGGTAVVWFGNIWRRDRRVLDISPEAYWAEQCLPGAADLVTPTFRRQQPYSPPLINENTYSWIISECRKVIRNAKPVTVKRHRERRLERPTECKPPEEEHEHEL